MQSLEAGIGGFSFRQGNWPSDMGPYMRGLTFARLQVANARGPGQSKGCTMSLEAATSLDPRELAC